MAQQSPFIFNRLYFNNVTLIDFYRTDGRDNLVIAFKRTAQRVHITDGRLPGHGHARHQVRLLRSNTSPWRRARSPRRPRYHPPEQTLLEEVRRRVGCLAA